MNKLRRNKITNFNQTFNVHYGRRVGGLTISTLFDHYWAQLCALIRINDKKKYRYWVLHTDASRSAIRFSVFSEHSASWHVCKMYDNQTVTFNLIDILWACQNTSDMQINILLFERLFTTVNLSNNFTRFTCAYSISGVYQMYPSSQITRQPNENYLNSNQHSCKGFLNLKRKNWWKKAHTSPEDACDERYCWPFSEVGSQM